MNVKRLFVIASVTLLCTTIMPDAAAQGYLSDATTSTPVLTRDPARQASTEIDAVVTNPAGVAFMPDGFHVSLGGIYSYRDISTQDPEAPATTFWTKETRLLPTIQAAWKEDRWTVSASFASEGGFGKRDANGSLMADKIFASLMESEFDGLNDIIQNFRDIWDVAVMVGAPELNIKDEDETALVSQDVNALLHNWTIRLGGTYKFNEHLSAYVGVKANFVRSSWDNGSEVVVKRPSTGERWDYFEYFKKEIPTLQNSNISENLKNATIDFFNTLESGIDIANSSNGHYEIHGWGFAPVIGIDYKTGNFNFGAKYEFASHINAKGTSEHFNVPASMAVGASWQIIPRLKVAAGSNVVFATYSSVGLDLNTTRAYPTRAYDLSVSGTFNINNKWLISGGYTYSHEQEVSNDFIILVLDAYQHHRISLGAAYSPMENMQINLGASIYPQRSTVNSSIQGGSNIEFGGTTFQILPYLAKYEYQPLVQVALGLNYSF